MLKGMKRIVMLGVAALPLLGLGNLVIGQEAGAQLQEQIRRQREQQQGQQGQAGQLQQDRERQRGQIGQQGQRGQQAVPDQELAQCLIIENQAEVQLAQFAQQHAQNEQVKQFAQQMAQEHQQFIQQLQQAAGGGQVRRAFRGEPGQPQDRQPQDAQRREQGQQPEQQPGQPPRQGQQAEQQFGQPPRQDRFAQAGQQGSGQGWMSIKQELAQQCVQSAKEALQNAPRGQFDEAFLSQMIFKHMQALDTLKVFQKHASSDLRQVLQQGQQTTQEHLQTAERLLAQIEQQGGQGAGQQPGQQNRRTLQQQERPQQNN